MMPDGGGDGDDGLAFVHADWRGHWDIQREMGTADTRAKDTDLVMDGH